MTPVDRAWPRHDLLAHRAAATPERTALVDADAGAAWTYDELTDAVDRTAAGLRSLGVTASDRLALLLDTSAAAVSLVHAAMRVGATLVPLDPDRPDDALRSMVARTDPAVLVGTEATIAGADLGVPETVVIEDPTRPAGGALAADETTAGPADAPPVASDWFDDETAVVMFTSGTTGASKGVKLTYGNLLASAVASAFRLGVAPDDRWYDALPVYHMGGFAPVVRSTLYGSTVVVQQAFDAERAAAAMADHGATCTSLVPTMLTRLLDAGWEPDDRFRFVLLGGAATPPALVERCERAGVPVCPTYGMTETASQVATARPEEAVADPETVGHPLLFTDVTVLGEDGDPVAPGDRGELVVSGPTVTPGYLDDEATDATFSETGFHTGDVGYRDPDGRLFVVGRVDDLIVTGGENVLPSTVADAIRGVQGVEDVAVLGLPDAEWGERVAALVAGDVAPADIERVCRKELAPYEVPKTVRVVDALPRTASGTVDREAARALLTDAA